MIIANKKLYDSWMLLGSNLFGMTLDELEDAVNEMSTERYVMGKNVEDEKVEKEKMDTEAVKKLIDDVFDKLFSQLDELKQEAVTTLNEPIPKRRVQ